MTGAPVVARLLFLSANANDRSPLAVDREYNRVKGGLLALGVWPAWRMAVEHVPAATWEQVPEQLLLHTASIVHFAGHGHPDGSLEFSTPGGGHQRVHADGLAGLFASYAGQVRLVVLNACYSDALADALTLHIDAVVGMTHAITDEAAILFAPTFYQQLAGGKSVKTAFEVGRAMLLGQHPNPGASSNRNVERREPAERGALLHLRVRAGVDASQMYFTSAGAPVPAALDAPDARGPGRARDRHAVHHSGHRHPDVRSQPSQPGSDEVASGPELLVDDSPAGPHTLPTTRDFVGRDEVLADLRRWRDLGNPIRITALVAVGGAGKTAVVRHLCDGAFVWSFYEDPKVEALVDALLIRFGQPLVPPGTRIDRLELALGRAGRLLVVLDGLEAVQADGSGDRAQGELEDPPLRRLLFAVAAGLGGVRVLLTTRYPPADLDRCGSYRRIDLPPLSAAESAALLATFGLADGVEVAAWVGGHALSLAMAGSYLRTSARPLADLVRLDLARARRDDPSARRLLSVLEAHAARLGAGERAVFAALSIFPAGATIEVLAGLPLPLSPAELPRAVAHLRDLGLARSDGPRSSLHPLVARYAATLLEQDGTPLHEVERARLARAQPRQVGSTFSPCRNGPSGPAKWS
jgi:hypothetical protein